MVEAVLELFETSGFMPHGHCFLWTPALLWSYIIADSVIFLSYFSIPVCLWYFVNKRQDLPFQRVFLLFGLFVMACGTTHFMGLVTIWYPAYGLDAGVKLFTAFISIVTAVFLWRLMPAALALPGRAEVVRANLELKLRTAELEAANHELDSFAYAVSHDLRGPLRAMSGFSQALIEDVSDKLAPEELVYLRHIAQAGEQMGHLIEGLLTLSRHMRAEMRRDRVDVSAMAAEIRADLDPETLDPVTVCPETLAPETVGPRVNWRIEPGLVVVGDRRLIRVVMSNLLSNAWKYTAKTANAEISISAREEGGARWVTVADNGAGFDMAHAARLFQPFQRLHRQDEFLGIGIGLATAQRIVARHGGVIRAEAAVGRGASFHFFLPARGAENEEAS